LTIEGRHGPHWRRESAAATRGTILPDLSEHAPAIEREVVCVFGTTSKSPWVTGVTESIALEGAYRVLLRHRVPGYGSLGWADLGPTVVVVGPSLGAQMLGNPAAHVRELGGLPAERVAEFFPVSRETFQRWVSGAVRPNTANLERLLRLRHLLQEVTSRVADVRSWLLAPLPNADGATPSDLLRAGQLTRVWDLLQTVPHRYPNPTYVDGDGHRITQMLHSTRGALNGTREDELDDFADWAQE